MARKRQLTAAEIAAQAEAMEAAEIQKAFEWDYKEPIKEDALVGIVRNSMVYLSNYDLKKLDEIDYIHLSEFFGEDITSEELLPEISVVKRIADVVIEALKKEKYSYELYQVFGITD